MNPSEAQFFDKNGEPITIEEWVTVFKWKDYFRTQDVVNGFTILTQWVGVDAPSPMERYKSTFSYPNWVPNDPPLPNQTIVWDADGEMVAVRQYPTSSSALIGHAALILEYSQ